MNLVTIMNFVRGVEPRNPNLDLLEPVVNQIALNKAYGFDNTFLLQYDALIDPKFQELFLAERDQHMELGIWFEVVQPLVEKVGIKWRGRPGYAWDWYVNPGFLPAYTHDEKIAMIDEFMETFRTIFGAYPQSVGSWLLDIDSVRYMTEKYAIRYFGICREQLAVDAYTLWGGPYNQPYYPSVHNILCPAQNAENQVNAPVFRLLGIEPIRGYNEKRYAKDPECYGCATMEPFWKYGQNKDYMEWFFKTYFDNENLGLAYTQIGQENSFGWKGMKEGLTLQLALVKRYADQGKIRVVKTSEAGRLFAEANTLTPPAALCADTDPVGQNGYKSFWYTSKNYRANVFFEGETLYFRDIQKFDERYIERYLDEPCLNWDAVYDNLPVVDERGWSFEKDSHDAGLDFDGAFVFEGVERDGSALAVTARAADGKKITIRLSESEITVSGGAVLRWRFGKFADFAADKDGVSFTHNGFSYRVGVKGVLAAEQKDLMLTGEDITLAMAE